MRKNKKNIKKINKKSCTFKKNVLTLIKQKHKKMKKIQQPKTTNYYLISDLEVSLITKVIAYYLEREKGSPEHDYILACILKELNS